MTGAGYKTCSECGARKGARAFRATSTVCHRCEGTLSESSIRTIRSKEGADAVKTADERRLEDKVYAGTGRRGGEASPMPGLGACRRALGLTVEEFALRARVAPSTISNLERGLVKAGTITQRRIQVTVVNERRKQREQEQKMAKRAEKAGI